MENGGPVGLLVGLRKRKSSLGTDDFASFYLDEHGGNSSIATAPSCSPSSIRVNSCGFP